MSRVSKGVIHGMLGVAGLITVNVLGLGLGLTIFNLLVAAALGVPGLALLLGVKYLF